MDSDALRKRTDKIVEILEADERLDDGMQGDVHVHKGNPLNKIQPYSGHHVFVEWDGSPTIKNRRYNAGARQDHQMSCAIYWLVSDYAEEEAAVNAFETLAANILRVMSDDENLQLSEHWHNLEIQRGGGEMVATAEHTYWRIGRWFFTAKFTERIN